MFRVKYRKYGNSFFDFGKFNKMSECCKYEKFVKTFHKYQIS